MNVWRNTDGTSSAMGFKDWSNEQRTDCLWALLPPGRLKSIIGSPVLSLPPPLVYSVAWV